MDLNHPEVRLCVNLWTPLFSNLLGWSEERVITWAERYEREIKEDSYPFNHDSLVYHASGVLSPRKVRGGEKVLLGHRIQSAIEISDGPRWSSTDYDWKAAKSRVDAILAEYGESLANVAREQDENFERLKKLIKDHNLTPVFSNLLEWPEGRVISWVQRYENYHGPAIEEDLLIYCIACQLVPRNLIKSLDRQDVILLIEKIQGAIENRDGPNWSSIDYDWRVARWRVDAVLFEHGESLANVLKESQGLKQEYRQFG